MAIQAAPELDSSSANDLPPMDSPAPDNDVVGLAKRLLAIPSAYPPGETHAVADAIADAVADLPHISVERYRTLDHVTNLVLRLKGSRPGKRLVFNGHMDTFPLTGAASWLANPQGEVQGDRLYGLGISDMKGGIAAIVCAMRNMALRRDAFAGELVAVFVGDEESMGTQGTQWLLDNVPTSRGDAMISADTGSPYVLRFGEKGLLWLTLAATGTSSHAAHVHRGTCANERLLEAIQALRGLRGLPVDPPAKVRDAISAAAPASEHLSGAGETRVLQEVTVTFGIMRGGTLSNLIADQAEATVDIRIPVGVDIETIEDQIRQRLAPHHGVSYEITRRYPANWTAPDHAVIQALVASGEKYLGTKPVVNMRVGASDARLYRAAGIPTVVCGLTPHNMGAPDEYVSIAEMQALVSMFVDTALSYLPA